MRLFSRSFPRRDPGRPARFRPVLEELEGRCLPSTPGAAPPDMPPAGGESRAAVTVGSSATVFALTPGGSLYRNDAGGWLRLGDFIAADSAVADASGNVVVFAQTAAGALARFDNHSGWQMLGGSGTISALGAGTDQLGQADVFVLTSDQGFARWTASGGWRTIGGAGSVLQWAAVPGGGVVAVTADHRLEGFNDTFGWYPLSGPGFARAVSAATDSSGRTVLWVQSLDHALYRFDPAGGWEQLGGSGTIASLSAGTDKAGLVDVFVVTTAGDFGRYDPQTGWAFVHPPGPVAEMSATGLGRVYVVLGDGSVFGQDDQFGFFRFTGPGFAKT